MLQRALVCRCQGHRLARPPVGKKMSLHQLKDRGLPWPRLVPRSRRSAQPSLNSQRTEEERNSKSKEKQRSLHACQGRGGRERFQKTDWPTRGQIGLPWKKQETSPSPPPRPREQEKTRILRWEGETEINEPYRTQNICVNHKAIGFGHLKIPRDSFTEPQSDYR